MLYNYRTKLVCYNLIKRFSKFKDYYKLRYGKFNISNLNCSIADSNIKNSLLTLDFIWQQYILNHKEYTYNILNCKKLNSDDNGFSCNFRFCPWCHSRKIRDALYNLNKPDDTITVVIQNMDTFELNNLELFENIKQSTATMSKVTRNFNYAGGYISTKLLFGNSKFNIYSYTKNPSEYIHVINNAVLWLNPLDFKTKCNYTLLNKGVLNAHEENLLLIKTRAYPIINEIPANTLWDIAEGLKYTHLFKKFK